MRSPIRKSTLREIKGSFGRFMAIFAIVGLGVGFFSGLKITKDAMLSTGSDYLRDSVMFDFRLISTLGLDAEDEEFFASLDCTKSAEGTCASDIIVVDSEEDAERVLRCLPVPEKINLPKLQAGRMPQSADECVADARFFDEDDIGTKISLTADGDPSGHLVYDQYTLTGLVTSPLWLNFERGTTTLGNGSVAGFLYIHPDGMEYEFFTDIYVTLSGDTGEIYSDEYKDAADTAEPKLTSALQARAAERYDGIKADAQAEIDAQRAGLYAAGVADPQPYLAEAEAALDALAPPDTFVLGRSSNVGYICFENDSDIVNGIARVFPVFFFLVAALIIITTMTRMVDEQRTQLGVLKATGYGAGSVMYKYMVYSGSATLGGCVAGYVLGIWLIPMIIWKVYGILYDFEANINFVFSLPLALISAAVALLCSVAATWLFCGAEFRRVPAELIRPKSPPAGKRILLERVGFIWRRLGFMRKVSIRNIMRYKKRMIMMVLGIGGCTALLITGYGIRDSIENIVNFQFDEITRYDCAVTFSAPMDDDGEKGFADKYKSDIGSIVFLHEGSADASSADVTKSVYCVTCDAPGFGELVDLHNGDGEAVSLPAGDDEAVINNGLAEALGVGVGDCFTLTPGDGIPRTLRICGISLNYVYNYVYLNAGALGGPDVRTAYIGFGEGTDSHEAGAAIASDPAVSSVSITSDMKDRVETMLGRLDYIVLLVLVCAGALAFIVLYNLTNINITERLREIATIKVLGFYPRECSAYVFRENFVLTAAGAAVGLLLGRALHAFVMSQIRIDMVRFDIHITWQSYLVSVALTFLFAVAVDLFMRIKISRINMAESLKSNE